MSSKVVLASKSKVRKNILEKNGFKCAVKPANIDEEIVKEELEVREVLSKTQKNKHKR